MSMSFLRPSRTVLFMTDDALYIYKTGPRGVSLVEVVPWGAENFAQNVAGIIVRDCGKRPVLILNDMVEQHYRKERIPGRGVGMMDKAGMIRRKLNMAFPNYPVKAYLPLKEKPLPPAPGAPAPDADLYIFAAVPATDQFSNTVSAVRHSLVSVAGFCLLPVESTDMVKALSDKMAVKGQKKPKWTIFMGQHKTGGLRQIVVKDGEIALTRMTMIADSSEDMQDWVRDVHKEFQATMSYLARFGFKAADGLNVIIISDPAAGDLLEAMITEECRYASFTVPQAARLLGLSVGSEGRAVDADLLHVAWAARKSKFTLPMQAEPLDQVSKPRRIAAALSLLLLGGAAFLGYQSFGEYMALSGVQEQLDDSTRLRTQLDVQYQKEVKRKENLGFDIKLIQSSVALHGDLEKMRVRLLPLFSAIGQSLGRDLRIDRIQVTPLSGRGFAGGGTGHTYQAAMYITYPGTTDIDRGNQEVRELRDRLASALPRHDVRVGKYLKDYEYVEQLVVEAGDIQSQDVTQDFVAEIIMRGGASE